MARILTPITVIAPLFLLLGVSSARADCGKANCNMHSQHQVENAGENDASSATAVFDHQPQPGELALCPVSGKSFTVSSSTLTSEHDGKYYAFCCPSCKGKFDADPDSYLDSPQEAQKYFPAPPEAGTQAVCPVTGKTFTVSDSTPVSEYDGRYYAFCCGGCKPKFEANPARYTE